MDDQHFGLWSGGWPHRLADYATWVMLPALGWVFGHMAGEHHHSRGDRDG